MMRIEAPLPTLPLWLAALIALSSEAALLAGLSQWSPPWSPQGASESADSPIDVSLVSAPVLADSAVVGAVGGPLDEETFDPEIAPEPEPEPEPKPVAPEPPAPVAVSTPDPAPEPVAVKPPKPKPTPVSKPKPKPRAHPRPNPKATSRPAPRAVAALTGRNASAADLATHKLPTADKGASASGSRSPVAYLGNPRPGYPDSARRRRQEGTVHLRVLVSPKGRAAEVRISGSSGFTSLDQASLRAVRRWRFKPARQNGRPISAWVRIPIRFNLNRSGG